MAKPQKATAKPASKPESKRRPGDGRLIEFARPSLPKPNFNAGLDPLIAFRLAYLRAVAGYWRDSNQFAQRLKEVQVPGSRRPFSHDQVMSEYCPGFEWPWDGLDLELKILGESQIEFGLNGNSGWTGPPNNVTIYLPSPPEKEDDYAEALAAYYAQFPSFFGSGLAEPSRSFLGSGLAEPARSFPGGGRVEPSKAPPSDEGAALRALPGLGAPIGTLPTKLGDLQSFFEFGAVIVRLLALLWQEQARAGSAKPAKVASGAKVVGGGKATKPPELTSMPQFPIRAGVFGSPAPSASAQSATQSPRLVSNGNAALMKFLGYAVPWNMTFSFVEAKDAVYEPSKPAGKWHGLPANRLEMHLPAKPKNLDTFALPVALTAYNSTGELYPLTCGC
jgi:ribosomally synthesized peptide (two-chain TOMM family)